MNNVAYFEIQADDPEKAVKFYTDIFGWKFIRDEHIPIPYYRIEGAGPNPDLIGANGGLLKRPANPPAGGTPSEHGTNAYVCSVQIENFDATAKKILENGGQVALPKFAIPGKCWQGYFLDTEGILLASSKSTRQLLRILQ